MEEIKYATKQQEFLDLVKDGHSVFLTGEAGTGKTFIVKEAIKMLKDMGKNVAALAPTGIAANNLNGQTMHSFFGLPIYGVIDYENCNFLKKAKRRVIDAVDVLFLDEISMVRADMVDGMNHTLKKNQLKSLNAKQIIFIGDMEQLPPIADDNFDSVLRRTYEGIEFYHSNFYKGLNVHKIELDEAQRQSDPEFIENLNIVRRGKKAPYFRKFFTTVAEGIVLAPHVETVNEYNIAGFNSIQGEVFTFTAVIDIQKEGAKINAAYFNVEPEINLKDGCKIMYLVNSQAYNNLKNGTLGIYRRKNNVDFIEVDSVDYRLEPIEFTKKEYVLDERTKTLELETIGSIVQIPVRLAYALTIHKCQGMTLETATIDLRRPCFSKGQLYVALSRVKSPEGLKIIM